jgi:hypothetical protein
VCVPMRVEAETYCVCVPADKVTKAMNFVVWQGCADKTVYFYQVNNIMHMYLWRGTKCKSTCMYMYKSVRLLCTCVCPINNHLCLMYVDVQIVCMCKHHWCVCSCVKHTLHNTYTIAGDALIVFI